MNFLFKLMMLICVLPWIVTMSYIIRHMRMASKLQSGIFSETPILQRNKVLRELQKQNSKFKSISQKRVIWLIITVSTWILTFISLMMIFFLKASIL